MITIYSPKIADDLIPLLYRIGKRESKPMTEVVDDFLTDSIRDYISSLDDSETAELQFDYQADFVSKKLKAPSD